MATASNPGTVIDNDAILNGVMGGDYILTVIDDQTGCVATAVTVTIFDQVDGPTFSVDAVGAGSENNTVCDVNVAGNHSGAISISTAETANYTFTWYDGAGTSSPTVYTVTNSSQNSVLSSVPSGTYTVNITDGVNECDTTFQVTIIDDLNANIASFDISSDLSVTDDNSYSSDNGSITFSEADLNDLLGGETPSNYLVRLYAGTSVNGSPLDKSSSPYTFSGLAPGDYTVQVVNPSSGCTTLSSTVTISEVLLGVIANVSGLVNNTVCDITNNDAGDNDANGSIIFTPDTDGVSSGNYTFSLTTAAGTAISDGSSYLDGVLSYDDDAVGSSTTVVTGLDAGDYIMNITDLDDMRTVAQTFTIVDDNTHIPVISIENIIITDNTTSNNTTYTGQADASGGVVGGTGDYSYEWTTTDGLAVLIDVDAVLNDVAAGDYILTVIDDQTGCVSIPTQVTIN